MNSIAANAPVYRFDLRSDILSPASPAVAKAIADAADQQGEFNWRLDPIEQELERRVCALLNKPAAALFPTCTAANIAALIAMGARDHTLVMEKTCHLMTNEMAGLDWLARPHVETFVQHVGGQFDIPRVVDRPNAIFCLENTHNRLGGAALSAAEVSRAAGIARTNSWSVFLDGSRLWNASVTTGDTPAALAAPADVVSVSFNKGLGAPNGAAIAGDAATVATAVEAWRRLGGICRPSHVIAAGALAALDEVHLLKSDHELARQAAAAIAEAAEFEVSSPQSNIVLVSAAGVGWNGAALASALSQRGLGCLPFGPQHIRLVFHRGIPAGSAPAIATLFRDALANAPSDRQPDII